MTVGRRELSDLQRLEDEIGQAALGHAVKSEVIPNLMHMLIRTNDVGNRTTQPDATNESNERSHAFLKKRSGVRTAIDGALTLAPTTPGNAVFRSLNWAAPEEFADLVLADDENIAAERIRLIQSDGIPDEELLLELLAPTSVELGRRWEEDICDFADVTIGVCRLHRIVRSLHPQNRRELVSSAHGGRVVLAPAPGDQHSFGLLLVGELLFRHGWYTDIEISDRSPHITCMVNENWYEMAGISISCETRVADAAALIVEIRRASCNPNIAILAGGPVFAENPAVSKALKADKIALPGMDIATLTTPFIPTPPRA